MFSSEVGDNDRQTQTVLRASGPAVCSTSLPVYKSQGKKRRLGVATKAADSQTPSSCGVRAQPLYSEPRSSDLRTSGAAKTEDAVPLHCSPEGAVRSGGASDPEQAGRTTGGSLGSPPDQAEATACWLGPLWCPAQLGVWREKLHAGRPTGERSRAPVRIPCAAWYGGHRPGYRRRLGEVSGHSLDTPQRERPEAVSSYLLERDLREQGSGRNWFLERVISRLSQSVPTCTPAGLLAGPCACAGVQRVCGQSAGCPLHSGALTSPACAPPGWGKEGTLPDALPRRLHDRTRAESLA